MILVSTFVICLILGVPVLAAIGMACIVPMLVDGKIPLTMIAQTLYTGADQLPLIAVTGFILAGALMAKSGITEHILEIASKLIGNITGGLSFVAIMGCMIFAAISGSGPATVAAIGGIMLPGMYARGYSRDFSAAVISSGGTMGILIPPSNPMIIYGVVANVSITKLFMAGMIPGLLVGCLMMLTAYLVSRHRGYVGSGESFDLRALLLAIWKGKWAILSPILILGGIYSGVFTPVEAAEIAVIYAIVIGGLVYRRLTLKSIYNALVESSLITGTIIMIVGIALTFGRLLTLYRVPYYAAQWLGSVSDNPTVVIFLIIAVLIFVGTFMETLAQIIVLTPVFLPIISELGIDPIHFGIIFIICCEIGFLTPPLGANLYVAVKMANVPLERLSIAVLPFLLALLVGVIAIVFFPQIALFLPELLY